MKNTHSLPSFPSIPSLLGFLGLFGLLASSAAGGQPNFYDCRSGDVAVRYYSQSGNGTLTYKKGPAQPITVSDARFEQTALGTLITFDVREIKDEATYSESLLLPTVNSPEDGASVDFDTLIISTVTQTSIAGPASVQGPLSASTSQAANCSAGFAK